MKILFFGTSEFGIPSLEKLLESDFQIVGVVTQPDKPVGRKQEPLPSPVKQWAAENKVSVFQPETLESRVRSQELVAFKADLYVVASYGKIIPKEILDIPKYGALNLHPSILPRYRGPSPIQTAILNGDKETGVTIIQLDEEMDHGPIVASIKYQVSRDDITYEKLHDELALLGADLLIKTLPDYVAGKITPREQEHDKATFTKLIKKQDARIEWNKSAVEIDRMVRAYSEWPVAWTTLSQKRVKVYKTLVHTTVRTAVRTSGEVYLRGSKMYVQCGKGALEITELQLEGRQKMNSSEFIKGFHDLESRVLK